MGYATVHPYAKDCPNTFTDSHGVKSCVCISDAEWEYTLRESAKLRPNAKAQA